VAYVGNRHACSWGDYASWKGKALSKKWIWPLGSQPEKIEMFTKRLGILPLTASILIQRGLDEFSAPGFLHPAETRFKDFKDLPGTVDAGRLLAEAIRRKELIVIFGDYDVDGITAAALLAEFINVRHGRYKVFLPNRMDDGYGLNQKAVEAAIAMDAGLLVTVDCGITAITEIELAGNSGLKVIITDHHQPAELLPPAEVIVNPQVTGPEEFQILAGVGVAFQVVRAAADALGEEKPEDLRRHLDLVALGTVADVVPLFGENRLLTRAGMAMINRGGRMGLRALISASGLGPKPINSTDIAFRLAPRLNAAGRMGDPGHSLELLLTGDMLEAEQLANGLDSENSRRQNLEQKIRTEVEDGLQKEDQESPAIVAAGTDWPLGVLGLVASRICEKYHRPCFILSESEGKVKGSGRSIAGFSLHAALSRMSGLLEKWGGHAMAAGVSMPAHNLEKFKNELQQQAGLELLPEHLQPAINIDARTDLKSISARLVRELKSLEPYGCGNSRPVLAINRLRLSAPPRVVKEKHLKLRLIDERKDGSIEAIGFGLGDRAGELCPDIPLEIAGHVGENTWNGKSTLQIEIKDFRTA